VKQGARRSWEKEGESFEKGGGRKRAEGELSEQGNVWGGKKKRTGIRDGSEEGRVEEGGRK